MKHVPPSIDKTAFVCPHCGAFAEQRWYLLGVDTINIKDGLPINLNTFSAELTLNHPHIYSNITAKYPTLDPHLSQRSYRLLYNTSAASCTHCQTVSIWICDNLIYPRSSAAPLANADLPEGIRRDYDEASDILELSPRGATALLRLVVQKLCKELGQEGENINDDIGALVSQGLGSQIQKALDVVRVVGNNAVHPGQIDLRDDRETALGLFNFVNLIVEKMISEPKRIQEAYRHLPKGASRCNRITRFLETNWSHMFRRCGRRTR